jgi:hypothetical protein
MTILPPPLAANDEPMRTALVIYGAVPSSAERLALVDAWLQVVKLSGKKENGGGVKNRTDIHWFLDKAQANLGTDVVFPNFFPRSGVSPRAFKLGVVLPLFPGTKKAKELGFDAAINLRFGFTDCADFTGGNCIVGADKCLQLPEQGAESAGAHVWLKQEPPAGKKKRGGRQADAREAARGGQPWVVELAREIGLLVVDLDANLDYLRRSFCLLELYRAVAGNADILVNTDFRKLERDPCEKDSLLSANPVKSERAHKAAL